MKKKQVTRQTASKKPARRPSKDFPPNWELRLKELKAFKKEHGHCNVPRNYPLNQPLAYWIDSVRRRKKQRKLSPETIRQLNELGICWTLLKRRFHRRDLDEFVAAVKAFKKQHGDCNFAAHVGIDPDMIEWLKNVRKSKKFGRLPAQYVQQLDRLGFIWRPREQYAQNMFAALRAYRKRYGNCNVPTRWPKNTSLAAWTSRMRADRRKKRLTKAQIQQLDQIGFCWDLGTWEKRLEELKTFKKKHRHCNVPYNYQPNLTLARWVVNIRHRKKQGILAKERVRLLNELGFCWVIARKKPPKIKR